MPDFDLAVIGSGPGGYVAAIHAARKGARVAVVEERWWGGTCLNIGCIPTKTLVHTAEVLKTVREAAEFGVKVEGIEVDWPQAQARKDRVVEGMRKGVQGLLKGNGIEMVDGHGRLGAGTRVVAAGRDLEARAVLLAPGSVPSRPPFKGAELGLTSDDILGLPEIPRRLAVIGGGVVGMEFASLFNALGAEVVVIEMLDQLLTPLEPEVAARFLQLQKRRGITFHLGASVESLERGEAGFRVRFSGQVLEADVALVATGRRPATSGLGLEEAGVALDRTAIGVDERLRTSVEGVYAIGDATGVSMLAHTASYQGEIAVANALGEKHISADYRAIPACVYTDPEVAWVGMSETQAAAAGVKARTGAFPFAALGRAMVLGETDGLVKLVADEHGVLLGGTVMGPRATDLIAEVTLAVSQGLTAAELTHSVHAHPTLPEAIAEAALDVDGQAVHILPRRRTPG